MTFILKIRCNSQYVDLCWLAKGILLVQKWWKIGFRVKFWARCRTGVSATAGQCINWLHPWECAPLVPMESYRSTTIPIPLQDHNCIDCMYTRNQLLIAWQILNVRRPFYKHYKITRWLSLFPTGRQCQLHSREKTAVIFCNLQWHQSAKVFITFAFCDKAYQQHPDDMHFCTDSNVHHRISYFYVPHVQ